jgi:hypothetical protein
MHFSFVEVFETTDLSVNATVREANFSLKVNRFGDGHSLNEKSNPKTLDSNGSEQLRMTNINTPCHIFDQASRSKFTQQNHRLHTSRSQRDVYEAM